MPVSVREWSDRFYGVGNVTENKGLFVPNGDICEERVAVEDVEADIAARQKVIDEKCRKYRSKWNKGRAFPYESRLRYVDYSNGKNQTYFEGYIKLY